MNKTLLYSLPLMAMMMASCGSKNEPKADGPAIVKTTQVVAAREGNAWQLPGRVKAAREVNLAFKVSGTLKRIAVTDGQYVNAGQVVAEMDDTDYRIQLQATEAEYNSIKAEADRVIALYEQQGTTASNYDKARYGLQQIEAKLAHHRNQLAYCTIAAPTSGRVQTTYFEAGETVGQGMPVIQIISNATPEIEVSLPQALGATLKGLASVTATATFTAYPGKTFNLTPIEILPKANSTGLYTMRLKMGGEAVLPSPGMSGWVTLRTAQDADNQSLLTMVPATAVCHTSTADYVYVVAGGKVKREAVSIQSINAEGMATISSSLKAGTTIVSSGVHHITDGQAVKPLAPATSTNKGALL